MYNIARSIVKKRGLRGRHARNGPKKEHWSKLALKI